MKKWIILLVAILIVGLGGYFIINGMLNEEPTIVNPEATSTPIPTQSVALEGEEEEVTEEPSPSLIPSEAASPSPIPSPTELPTSTPTATVAPTATPIPLPTQIPVEEMSFVYEVQRGDNVWYRFTEDTLYVTGTGKVDEWKDASFVNKDVELRTRLESITRLIIEEGITEIGAFSFKDAVSVEELYLPQTLIRIDEYAFVLCGFFNATGKLHVTGLDKKRIEVNSLAFTNANINDDELTAGPTPTPTPIPAPKAEDIDPNNPKRLARVQMGDSIFFEFYDNGELYVKGSGRTWDMQAPFLWHRPNQRNGKDVPVLDENYTENIKRCYIDDDITHLGKSVMGGLTITEVWISANITEDNTGWSTLYAKKIHLKTAEGIVTVTKNNSNNVVNGDWVGLDDAIAAYKSPDEGYIITK